jgi:hypothetical protein
MTEEQGVTRRQRRTSAQIEQMVREFRESGLTGRQFCLREGLSPSMLYRYLRRTAWSENGHGDGLVAVELASRKPAAEAGSCGLAVVLAGGRKISVSAGFDGLTLRRLVQALETM